jgi:hypothetical protein
MSPNRRNLLAVLLLLALLLLAFPLLNSLFGDLVGTRSPNAPTVPGAALLITASSTPSAPPAPTDTTTATFTRTITLTPTPSPTVTHTPTSIPTATDTPTATPTATPRPRVYLLPFVQVFAVGQPQPATSTQVLLYEGGNDIFEVIAGQGPNVRLQTLDAALNFWTANNNIASAPPLAAQYDYSVRGKTARLASTTVFACAYNNSPTLAFGACQQLSNVSTAMLVARIAAGSSFLYLAQIGGTQYIVPASSIGPIS